METVAGNPTEPRTGGTQTARPPDEPAPGGPRDRARGALLGLAVGDALGAPAENMRPSEIRRRWGRIEGFVSDDPAGTDDTEYAIFSGLLLARHGSELTVTDVERAWRLWIADVDEGPFRGAGFSERGTLENLRRGLAAPISAQHRHAWSDGLAMRAAPFGVFAAGRPAEAARLVAVDGRVSHEGEGIYGGQAVAAGVAAAMTGASLTSVIAAALSVIPMDSWTARSLRRAVAAAQRPYPDRLTGERAVRSAVVVGGYPWTDLAPEAVGLAFGAFAAARGDFRTAVLTAVNMGRDADTTAAVAGALAGALHGASAIPRIWSDAIGPVRGSCLPSMRGYHVVDVADLLAPRAAEAAAADEPPPRAPGAGSAERAVRSPASGCGPGPGPAEPPGHRPMKGSAPGRTATPADPATFGPDRAGPDEPPGCHPTERSAPAPAPDRPDHDEPTDCRSAEGSTPDRPGHDEPPGRTPDVGAMPAGAAGPAQPGARSARAGAVSR